MSDSAALRKTPLHAEHVAAGARMVDFGGWSMPVQYSGLVAEHVAVRTRAGLFDVSHMGEVTVRGPQALDYLQYLTSNNVAKLRTGRAHYTALTTPAGCFVDDLLIYKRADDDYLLVINAGNTPKDVAWLAEHAPRFDVEMQDVSEAWAQLALQGPEALAILDRMVGPSPVPRLADLRYYAFVETAVAGADCIVSRTGYTGEDGFEVYAPRDAAAAIWRAILAEGSAAGVVPVGLGARDTLRLEAKMALYGNDIDDTTTLFEADLGWIVKLDKGDFIGRDVLARQRADGVEHKLVGFEVRGRGIARQGHKALHGGREVGRVTSGTHAPTLKKAIGLAYLPIALSETGTEFDVDIRGRSERAEVVPTPFYRRSRRHETEE